MTTLTLIYILTFFFAAFALLSSSTSAEAQPEVEAWLFTPNAGWKRPPIGGPRVQYVRDRRTGKQYLVEMDAWGEARISDADLNDLDEPTK